MKYKAEAVLGLSNWGGVSIMIDPEEEDYLYYQWYEEEPVREEVLYIEDPLDREYKPCFMIEGQPYFLDEFLRVDYGMY